MLTNRRLSARKREEAVTTFKRKIAEWGEILLREHTRLALWVARAEDPTKHTLAGFSYWAAVQRQQDFVETCVKQVKFWEDRLASVTRQG